MLRTTIVCYLTAMILTSCRTSNSHLSDVIQGSLPPVIVVTGGFSSCGWVDQSQVNGGAGRTWGNPGNMDMAEALDDVRHEYSNFHGTTAPQFVVSCYNGKSSSYIYYFSSKNKKLRYTRWNELSPLIAEIDTFKDSHEVYFIGHSYGGWLAMQLANGNKVKSKKAVITIDPISPYKCNQVSFAASVVTNGSGVPGCTSFPEDITQTHTKATLNKFAAWHHYYQVAYKPLHSNVVHNNGTDGDSDIKNGGFGYIVPYSSGGTLGGVHTKIDTAKVVWDKLRQLLGIGMSQIAANPQIAAAIQKNVKAESLEPVVEAALLPNDDPTEGNEQVPLTSTSAINGQESAPAQMSQPRGVGEFNPSSSVSDLPEDDAPSVSFGRL